MNSSVCKASWDGDIIGNESAITEVNEMVQWEKTGNEPFFWENIQIIYYSALILQVGPSDLLPPKKFFKQKEGFHVVHSGQGLMLAVPQIHQVVGSGLVIKEHAVVDPVTRHPHATESPVLIQCSLDGV